MRVTDTLDYRKFLQDFYQAQRERSSFFSYRYMAQKIDLDPSFLIRILQGKKHLPDASIAGVSKLCGFDRRETVYFENLVLFGKARSDKESRARYEKLMGLKSLRMRTLVDCEYAFYSEWHHAALRALLEFSACADDCQKLGEQLDPPISANKARESIRLLERLGLVRREGGKVVLTDSVVSTRDAWRSTAIARYQADSIRLASEALDRHPQAERDISTVTLGCSSQDLPALRELTREYRETVLKIVCESQAKSDRVYQLNIQLFPLSKLQDVPS